MIECYRSGCKWDEEYDCTVLKDFISVLVVEGKMIIGININIINNGINLYCVLF